MPADASFARFARRLTLGYAVLALVLILAVVAVSSILAGAIYGGSVNDSLASSVQRAEVLAAQYEAEGQTLPEYASLIVSDLSRTHTHVFVFDDDRHIIAGSEGRMDQPPSMQAHFFASIFGIHSQVARVPGGTILVMPDAESLTVAFVHYLAVVIPAGIVAIGLAWLAARRITRRAIAPLASVTTSLRHIAAGDFSPQPLLEEGADLRDLTAAYNEVAHRLTVATAERERNELQMRQFIADAGHELRTPLTVVMGYLEMLQRGSIVEPSAVDRVVATMLAESRRMRGSIEKLILLARLERPEAPQVGRIDAADLARRVEAALEPLAGAGRIRVSGGSAPVDGDESELYEAFKNVTENAVRYAPDSPITIDVATEGSSVRVAIADRGPGMSPAELDHAFDRFYRGEARDAAGDPIEGSGLGLAIAKRAVERAGGSIAIESRPGEGTCVRVVLPAAT